MVRPSAVDPPEITFLLWDGFGGGWEGPPLGTGWDIGANCGQSVLTMRKLFTKIVSFEPHPESYEYCRVQYPDLDIRCEAVSYRDGKVELALPPGEQTDTGQLVTAGTPGMEWSRKDWSGVPRITVPCRTVDSLAKELGVPAFIKVDTEGHEARVMDGAKQVLSLGIVDWLIEFHSEANSLWCQQELIDQHYEFELVHHPHYREGGKLWKNHGWLRAKAPR
jgi:FkbM family methyltransferase